MNADSPSGPNLHRLKWTILGLAALALTAVEAFYYFVRGVPLIEDLFDWLLGMAIAWVLIEIAFREAAKLQARLQREVIERVRTEEELKAQRDFALQVMNMMGQGLTVTNKERRFEYVNPAYARMIGCSPEDLIGKMPKDVTQAEDHAALNQGYALRLKGETGSYETRLRRVDGSAVPVLLTAAPYWREGQVVGSITVITDLTERKQTEEEIRRRTAQLEALRQVSLELT